MIDHENIQVTIIKGLREYLGCPVIRSNQNVNPPKYPYLSYTMTIPQSQNKGTWQEHEDGVKRKAITITWSITSLSDNSSESVMLANKARDWLDQVGTEFLNDNNVIIQSVGAVRNRDNFLTTEYEYRNGFDIVIWAYDVIDGVADGVEYIESFTIGNVSAEAPATLEELNDQLEKRLDGEVV